MPRQAGNDVQRFRVPTAAERAGDFSQTFDNNGNPYSFIRDRVAQRDLRGRPTRAAVSPTAAPSARFRRAGSTSRA